MSFLGNILRRILRRKAEEEISNAVYNKISGNNSSSSGTYKSEKQPEVQATDNNSLAYNTQRGKAKLNVKHTEPVTRVFEAVGSAVEDKGSTEYFTEVISKNFPGVSIARNVSLSDIGAAQTKKAVNADIVLEKAGRKVMAIVLVNKNSYRTAGVVDTLNGFESRGIPAVRFIKEFRNEPGYIVGRINAVSR